MNKKGQEEIVGFVAVVLVVAVVFLVVLGIVLWYQKDLEVKSTDVLQFLESSLQTTSNCALDFEPAYVNLGELLIACYSQPGKQCKPSGQEVCRELNKTLQELLDASWKVGGNYSLKGYEFKAVYRARTNQTEQTNILEFNKGICEDSFISEQYLLPERQSRGTIVAELRLCS